MQQPPRRKFRNVPAVYGGQRYDSTGEAEYARQLDLRNAAGAIRDWRRGRVWTLLESRTGRRQDGITLRPDYEVWDADGGFRVVDFKGVLTRDFWIEVNLWRVVYPQVPPYVVNADGREERLSP
jgi:hypothetical protein